jgi:hypothetical protein
MEEQNERMAREAGDEAERFYDDELEYDYVTNSSRLSSIHFLIHLDGTNPNIQLTNGSSLGLSHVEEYDDMSCFNQMELVERLDVVFVKLVSLEDRLCIAREVREMIEAELEKPSGW